MKIGRILAPFYLLALLLFAGMSEAQTVACPFSDMKQIASGITATTFTDAVVSNGSSYVYQVAAVNSSGSACTPPTGAVVIPDTGAHTVALTWTASTTQGVTYTVFRSGTHSMDDAIIHRAALRIHQRAVLGLAVAQARNVIAGDRLKKGKRFGAANGDLAHVAHVKQPGPCSHDQVLLGDARVLDGHVPAAELRDARARRLVDGVKRRALWPGFCRHGQIHSFLIKSSGDAERWKLTRMPEKGQG